MIDLSNNDILQISATVIAGALIFLTISSTIHSIADVIILTITAIFGLGMIIIIFIYCNLHYGKRWPTSKFPQRKNLIKNIVDTKRETDHESSRYLGTSVETPLNTTQSKLNYYYHQFESNHN